MNESTTQDIELTERGEKVRPYNNYSLAILTSLLAGIGVSLYLILMFHLSTADMPDWLYKLFCAFFGLFSVSGFISGGGYLFTGFDILFKNDTALQIPQTLSSVSPVKKFIRFVKTRKFEFIGLVIGFLITIPITVLLVFHKIKGAAGKFAEFIPIVGPVLSFILNISMISGLFSRSGRAIDYFRNNRENIFRGENVNYVLSVMASWIIGGLIVGLVLGLVGVTSAMTFGAAIPIWCAKAFFAVGILSATRSAGGYIGRIADFVLGDRVIGMERQEKGLSFREGIKSRANYERKLTVVGVSVGIVISVILIATSAIVGLATIPFFGFGLPIVAASFVVFATMISAMGGLGNRIGYCIDRKKGVGGDGEHAKKNTGSETENKDNPGPATYTSASKLLGENSEQDLDRRGRDSNPPNVEVVADSSGLRSVGSGKHTLFGKNLVPAFSGSHSARLDASGDEWTRLRQKAESRKIDPTHTYNNDYRARRGREQVERVGNGSRRLCYQAAVAA